MPATRSGSDVGHVPAGCIIDGLVTIDAGEADHVGDAVLAEPPGLALHVDVFGEPLGREPGAILQARNLRIVGDEREAQRDVHARHHPDHHRDGADGAV